MHDHSNHMEFVKNFAEEQRELFETSEQAMYVFLDDNSRVCNEKFAKLLGYASAEEWMNTETPNGFPDAFVDEKSQEILVETYQNAMEKGVATQVKIAWKKKAGGSVETTVILAPVVHDGHLLALHFVA